MTTQEKDPLARVKRICQQLLNRTTDAGCSEAEALEAAAKVGELMAQHELELTDIMVRETKMVQRELYAADSAAQGIVTGIGKLCSLVTYHKTGQNVTTFVLYGDPHDMELAFYLYEVCVEALEEEWVRDMAKHGHTKKRREDFRKGFANRVRHRMELLRDQRDEERRQRVKMSGCTDLVVLKDQLVEAEFEKTGVKLTYTKVKIHDVEAYRRGAVAGEKVNLNNPLTSERQDQSAIQ